MGRRKSNKPGIYGPERNGRGWRIRVRDAQLGTWRSLQFESKEEAERRAKALREAAEIFKESKPLELIPKYIAFLQGRKASYHKIVQEMLGRIFSTEHFSLPIEMITPERVRAWYKERVEQCKPATHHRELAAIRTFFSWAIDAELCKKNPAVGTKVIGHANRGKFQLTIVEARLLTDYCFEVMDTSTWRVRRDAALGILTALLHGMRPSEVRLLRVKHIDLRSRTIQIQEGKTIESNRTLQLAEVLVPYFERQVEGKKLEDWIFESRYGECHYRNWLNKCCKKFCRDLNLPVISAHALRGMHSGFARVAGATGDVVSAALGHVGQSMRLQHYTKPEDEARAVQRQVETVLLVPRPALPAPKKPDSDQ